MSDSTTALVNAIDGLCEVRARLAVATAAADRMEIVGVLEDAKSNLLVALLEFAEAVRA